MSDFADVLDAPFLLGEARMNCCVPVRRSGTEKNLSNSVDPNRLRTQKQYDKELHCLTVNLRFC